MNVNRKFYCSSMVAMQSPSADGSYLYLKKSVLSFGTQSYTYPVRVSPGCRLKEVGNSSSGIFVLNMLVHEFLDSLYSIWPKKVL